MYFGYSFDKSENHFVPQDMSSLLLIRNKFMDDFLE
jgi:hypothetical protein